MQPTVFTGRQNDLQLLHRQLDLALDQGSRLVLISAPAGAGKTALVQQFGRALPEGLLFASGRGWDNRTAVPYYALREVVLQLARQVPLPQAPASSYLKTFLDGRGTREMRELPPDMFFRHLAEFLRGCGAAGLCLFIDDLQWADEGTFEWFDFALRDLADAPLLWIGACRSDEPALAGLAERRAGWLSTDRFDELALEPLSQEEIGELARHSIPESQWEEVLPQRIWQRSQGNALLAVEEIRACANGEAPNGRGQALIEQRLATLAEDDYQLLSQAAVIGERFGADSLSILAEEQALAVLQRLDILVRRSGLLFAEEQGFRFVHNRYRETLLALMPPALREAYHQRLGQMTALLPAEERTYHLVQAGDAPQGVEALIQEGDRARDLLDWRDALRYYVEALWLVQRAGDDLFHLRRFLYERIGDLQLTAAREPELARGYYEAALGMAPPPDRIRLLCRLADTYWMRNADQLQIHSYLEEAIQLTAQVEDRRSHAYLLCLQAEIALACNDRDRARGMAEEVHAIQDVAGELLLRSRTVLMTLAGIQRQATEIRQHADAMRHLAPDSWALACHHRTVANAYGEAGHMRTALEHHLKAVRIFQSLGRRGEAMQSYSGAGVLALRAGAYEEARSYLQQCLQEPDYSGFHDLVLSHLCKSWLFDRHPQGIEWAECYMDARLKLWLDQKNRDATYGMGLHRLGMVERIYRDSGQERAFHQLMGRIRQRLQGAGFQTESIWYFDAPTEPPTAPEATGPAGWQWTAGSEAGNYTWDDNLYLRSPPVRGFLQMDMPRLTQSVAGDFDLCTGVQGTGDIIAEMQRCRQEVADGAPVARGGGGGGLLLVKDRRNALRIFAHIQAPGEVICTLRRDGRDHVLGRGLLADGPIRLHLERRGATVRAYAGDVEGDWYLCGVADLPGWDEVEVGVYGECLIDLYAIVEEGECRFDDIGLSTAVAMLPPARPEAALCDLPRPKFAAELPGFVAAGGKMRRLVERVRRAAADDAPVLIQGETGTGKELIARALHRLSRRSTGPFIALNCAAIASELLERELFGHVRGAYTGAHEARGGLFEAAADGTLFLDEISEASADFQVRLLRVIEERAVRRVGDTELGALAQSRRNFKRQEAMI